MVCEFSSVVAHRTKGRAHQLIEGTSADSKTLGLSSAPVATEGCKDPVIQVDPPMDPSSREKKTCS